MEEGAVTRVVRGRTQVVRPEFDPAIEQRIGRWFDRYHSIRLANFAITDTEMAAGIGSPVNIHPCHKRST